MVPTHLGSPGQRAIRWVCVIGDQSAVVPDCRKIVLPQMWPHCSKLVISSLLPPSCSQAVNTDKLPIIYSLGWFTCCCLRFCLVFFQSCPKLPPSLAYVSHLTVAIRNFVHTVCDFFLLLFVHSQEVSVYPVCHNGVSQF